MNKVNTKVTNIIDKELVSIKEQDIEIKWLWRSGDLNPLNICNFLTSLNQLILKLKL